jgi:hypothetical protein
MEAVSARRIVPTMTTSRFIGTFLQPHLGRIIPAKAAAARFLAAA